MNKRGMLVVATGIFVTLIYLNLVSSANLTLSPQTAWCYSPKDSLTFLCTDNLTSIDGISASINIDSTVSGWANTTWATAINSGASINSVFLNTTIQASTKDNVFFRIQVFNNSNSSWTNASNCNYSFPSGNTWYNQTCNLSSYIKTAEDINSLVIRTFAYRTFGGGVVERIDFQSLAIDYNPDNIPPSFSNYTESPTNNSAYVSEQVYKFNVTITEENINRVWIEFNEVNYTFVSNVSNVYMFNRTNLAAGTYSYKWWANDTLGNLNNSGIKGYTIKKAENNLTLLSSDGDWLITYGTETTFECFAGYGTPNLYINNTEVSNPVTIILAAGTHSIKCNVSESQNYTSEMSQGTLIVNRASSQTSLVFDKSPPQTYGTSITPNCSVISGVGNTVLTLNGSVIISEQALTLGAGTWNFNCSLAESQNYSTSSEQINYIINKTQGNISLWLNGQENNITIDYPQQYNVTATTLYGDVSIYFDGSDITSNNSLNVTPPRVSGNYNVTAVSSGDENHSSLSITRWLNVTLDVIAPELQIISPQDGGSYGYNISLPLNFSVSDEHLLDSCWYNLNSGENITLVNCNNSTFNISSDGSYTIYLYANDTLGNVGSKNSTFSVLVGFPTIILNSPIGIYLNSNDVTFRYTPSDFDLESCELWGNFDGEFKLNQTNNSLNNGVENIFSLHLEDGTYLWNIRCNDSFGNSVFNGNKTFYVDTVSPSIIITEPKGTKSSWTSILLTYTISDSSPVSCKYSVDWATGVNVLPNTSLTNCNSITFNLSSVGDYILNLYATDFASNFKSESSSFTVSTFQPPTPSGGGGGGGGGGISNITVKKDYNLELNIFPNLIVDPGESKKIILSAQNVGKNFLNDCKIKGKGENAAWISSEGSKGLSIGEKKDFIFTLKVPEWLKSGSYILELSLMCQEHNKSTSFTAEIIEKKLGVELIKTIRENEDKVKIVYALSELSGTDQEVEVEIILFGEGDERLVEIKERRYVDANSRKEFETILNIPELLEGNFNLLINGVSQISSTFVQEEIVLGISRVGGLAIFDRVGETDTLFSIILAALFIIFSIFILRRIFKLRKLKKIKTAGNKRAVMIIDGKIVEKLKRQLNGKNHKGKWIHVKKVRKNINFNRD